MSSSLLRSCTLRAIAALLLLWPLARTLADPAVDAVEGGHEYQTKAAFLLNFAKFVDWPARKFTQPDSPFIIGVIGSDPFNGLLEEAAQSRKVNERTVIVKHIEDMEELRKCHILFVCRSETARLGPILSEVRGENVLTVGETDKFISHGGIINFVMEGDEVRFEINDFAARRTGLKISSKLQQLAVRPAR